MGRDMRAITGSTIRIMGLVGIAALVAAGCGGSGSSKVTGGSTSSGSGLNGAGSTFQEPLVVKMSGEFARSKGGSDVNYQGVGSGAGIEQFTKQTVDFGGTDAPMKDEELAAAAKTGGDVLHVPIALGAVVVSYNLKGVDALKLDGPTLAGIFEGKVKTWDDAKIAALNPGVKLPSTDIAVVHRSDESGTTFVFTGYLTAADAAWKSGPGQSKAPKWPTGSGAQGNDGVAAAVQQQDGAIGYTEIAYALQNDMTFAQLKNQHGDWVTASLDSTTKAGDGVTYPEDLRFSLLDSTAAGAYPIVSATWQLVWKDSAKAGVSPAKAKQLQAWLRYELGDGQQLAAKLDYAPLPEALRTKALAAVDAMQVG
jgi:phosphate transport system substrate-binding protein